MQLGGASGNATPQAVRPDGDFVYVAGYYGNTVDFDPAQSYSDNRDLLTRSGEGYFLAKYTAAGQFVWTKDLGPQRAGSSSLKMDRDASGNFYVTAGYRSASDLGGGVTLADHGAATDSFLAKLDPDGNALWAKRFASEDLTSGGSTWRGPAEGRNVTADAAGNVYTVGSFQGRLVFASTVDNTGVTVPSIFLDNPSITDDLYVTKHDPSGTLHWAKQVDGVSGSWVTGYDIAVDGAANVLVAGTFSGTADFDPGSGVSNLTSRGDIDAFVLRLGPGGNYLWTGQFGGTNADVARSIVIDGKGDVIVSGYFRSAGADFDPGPGVVALTPVGAGTNDAVLVKLNPSNQLVWVDQFGDDQDNSSLTVAVDASNNIYAGGQARGHGGDFDPGPGVVTLPGGSIGYFLRLGPGGNLDWIAGVATLSDPAGAVAIHDLIVDGAGNVYASGLHRGRNDFDPGQGQSILESPAANSSAGVLLKLSQVASPGIAVASSFSLVTTEDGGRASFTVRLSTQPTADVTIPITSNDITEGTVSTSALTYTPANWDTPQTVVITGVDDTIVDGDILYWIVLGAASSADPAYNGLDRADLTVTNLDDDLPPTKFFVVDDAATDRTYEYAASGTAVENYSNNSGNTAPRGAATTAAGTTVWVVDANKKVYVYNTSGGLLGSWTAGTLAATAAVEGITTNGTDIWIVDGKQDKVFRYTNAASLRSGSQNAASTFSLNSGNADPKDIVTDGTSLWVVNDSSNDNVFKYTLTGSLLGSWTITGAGSNPTGITLDPSGGGTLWTVDSGTDRVYQFDGARTRTSGSQSPSTSFALAAGNTNPQGIADPPVPTSGASRVAPLTKTSHPSGHLATHHRRAFPGQSASKSTSSSRPTIAAPSSTLVPQVTPFLIPLTPSTSQHLTLGTAEQHHLGTRRIRTATRV